MAPYESYDQGSGQVFSEVIIPARKTDKWWDHCTGRTELPTHCRRRGLGASSLHDTALRVCAFHAAHLTPETLVCAEWHYASKIYRWLKQRDALTFRIWATFRSAFANSTEIDQVYPLNIRSASITPHEIETLQPQLDSLPFAHLAHLAIFNLHIRHTHLMDLLKLPNLAVLIVQVGSMYGTDHDTGVDDRFIKRWGEEARRKNAFTKLRVLALQHFDIDPSIALRNMTTECFPQLSLVNMCHFYLPQDEDGIDSDSQITSKGHWRSLPNEGSYQGGQVPHAIWTHTRTTIHEKMQLLYRLAGTLIEELPVDQNPGTVVSIAYALGTPPPFTSTMYYSWFLRAPIPDADAALPAKRTNPIGTPENEDGSKKRKVRESKQKDIGALLGSFG